MFWNYLKIALRNLVKNKLFAAINICGLAIGLAIYIFGGLLVNYESSYDSFFSKSDRIYTVGSVYVPGIGLGSPESRSTVSTLKPIFDAEISDIDLSARTFHWPMLARYQNNAFFETVTFTDPELLGIFDFTYLQGSANALDNPDGIVLTEAAAIKYFGRTDVLGEVITLRNNTLEFNVSAVISIPQNSHFNGGLDIPEVTMFASLKRMESVGNFRNEGSWDDLNSDNSTYVLLPTSLDGDWLQDQLDGIYDRADAEDMKTWIKGFKAVPLHRSNLSLWDSLRIPMPEIIRLLSLLVLITACVNYTNLAVAQSMSRSREIGMRKVVGASRAQLLSQFIIESLVVAAVSMLLAIGLIEMAIPAFNNLTNKALQLDYLNTLPWLMGTTILVGIFAGLYPAWLVVRTNATTALQEAQRKGKKGAFIRSAMIGLQFSISAFMLAIVAVMFAQNKAVENASYIFPRSEIYTLQIPEPARARLDILRHEIEAIPDVESMAFSSQVPYQNTNVSGSASRLPDDDAGTIGLSRITLTPEFLDTYDIPLLAGRNLSSVMANDQLRENVEGDQNINVIVNTLALNQLGFGSPEEAIGQAFYNPNANGNFYKEARIVGVVPTQNLQGLMDSVKPYMFFQREGFRDIDIASIRISTDNFKRVVDDVESAWARVNPDLPMNGSFLDEFFNQDFRILAVLNMVIAGLASITMLLALIGLFALAAIVSVQRTREIGIRKVLGATSVQIIRMLVLQFSKPAMWALLLTLPAAYFASNLYLNLFIERIGSPFLILLLAGALALILAWVAVVGHAFRVAGASPINAIRHE